MVTLALIAAGAVLAYTLGDLAATWEARATREFFDEPYRTAENGLEASETLASSGGESL